MSTQTPVGRPHCLFLILLHCLFYVTPAAMAQDYVIRESFSSRDLNRWSGDTTDFSFTTSGANTLLQLSADSAGSSMISVPADRTEGIWEIFVDADLSPSNNNYLLIWLLADRPDLRDQASGFALRIGENGSDDRVRLLRMENGTAVEEILQSTTNYAGGGPLRILTERNNGRWKLYISTDYQIIPELQAENPASSFTGPAWFGFEVIYSASNTDAWQFDLEITPEPLRVTGAEVKASDEVRISFNLPLAYGAEDRAVFTSGSDLPDIVQRRLDAPDTLNLRFSQDLPSGPRTLRIRALEAANGSVLSDTLVSFSVYDTLQAGDLLISEFMNDPPSGCPEYLEIHNPGSKYLSAKGLQVADNRSIRMIETTSELSEGSFLLLTPDSTAMASCFGPGDYTTFSLPSLNNSSDEIRIYDTSGLLIDSLSYTADWGDPDFSLERRSYEVPAYFSENWQVSGSDEGGTPGRPNRIQPDTTAPDLLYLQFLSERSVQFIFSERLSEERSEAQISSTPALLESALSFQNHTLTLFIEDSFTDRQSYEFSLNGLEDIFGNRSAPQTVSGRYLRFSEAIRDDIRINEFRNRTADGEFLELFNASNKNVDLSNWRLTNSSGSDYVISDNSFLAPSEYLIAGDPEGTGSRKPGLSLKETADQIILSDHEGQVIDSLFFDPSWLPDNEQCSLEKTDPYTLSADASKWIPNQNKAHSAGRQNSAFIPDKIPPAIVSAKRISPVLIQVEMSEFVRESGPVYLDDIPLTTMPYRKYDSDQLILNTAAQMSRKKEKIFIPGLSDHSGNSADLTADVQQLLRPGDLLINEILFDPLTDPEDGIPDQTEFVELFNLQDFPLQASGLFLTHQPDENGRISPMNPVFNRNHFIPANAYFLIYADNESTHLSESSLGRYFDMTEEQDVHSATVSRSTLGLSSESDALFLAHTELGMLDSLQYSNDWHNPNLITTKGISLERISFTAATNDRENWSSSASALGATPLLLNSISLNESKVNHSARISISPDPFSPNADGYEDHTLIRYEVGEQDHMLEALIFDRYGRMIRELRSFTPAGLSGEIIWDGIDKYGRTVRPGFYIILITATDRSSGKETRLKKTVAVAPGGS